MGINVLVLEVDTTSFQIASEAAEAIPLPREGRDTGLVTRSRLLKQL
jgi:hypothetical protein